LVACRSFVEVESEVVRTLKPRVEALRRRCEVAIGTAAAGSVHSGKGVSVDDATRSGGGGGGGGVVASVLHGSELEKREGVSEAGKEESGEARVQYANVQYPRSQWLRDRMDLVEYVTYYFHRVI
jgi:hypothetical protein